MDIIKRGIKSIKCMWRKFVYLIGCGIKHSKCWFNSKTKNEKFFIGGVSLATLLVITVCCFTFDFSRVLGNVYDIEDIGTNIDDIEVGDRIDYEVNDFNDWKVLSINKEDNTIDIVANSTPEQVAVNCGIASCNEYPKVLQKAADKYVDGKYAIRARSIAEEDLKVFDSYDSFWLSKKSGTRLYHSNGSVDAIYQYGAPGVSIFYFVPIVTVNVDNAAMLNVGDNYNIMLHTINEWIIIGTDVDNNRIDIVPKDAPVLNFATNDNGGDFEGVINFERQKYYADNVYTVRTVNSSSDVAKLNAINYGLSNNEYEFFAGYSDTYNSNYSYLNIIAEGYINYDIYYYYNSSWDNEINTSRSTHSGVRSLFYTAGFRPVVTLKYSSEEKDGKDKNDELEIGDYVKYSANAYNNWRVLDIDKENNTVDIISGGIVNNISLHGINDYKNFSSILQKEVDKYKVGKGAVSARLVAIKDLDNLKKMKDGLDVKYFLNNKTKYRPKNKEGTYLGYTTYVVGIAYYDSSASQLISDWAMLEYEAELNIYNPFIGSYQYAAGVRPIVTLELSKVEEITDVDDIVSGDKTDDSLKEQQEETNRESQNVISNLEIIEEDIIVNDENSIINENKGTNDLEIKDDSSKVEHVSSIKYIVGNKLQDKVYKKIIIITLIIIILTVVALFAEYIKILFKKCDKRKLFIVVGLTIFVTMVITLLSKNSSLSNIKGSVYEIDDVQIGDDFDYTANGYSDWEVLDIDRENKTLEIVSKTSVEDLTIPCADEMCSEYYDTLQNAANKYINGNYVISARSITEEDKLRNYGDNDESIWIKKRDDNRLYYSYYNSSKEYYDIGSLSLCDSYSNGYIVPVVTLNVSNTSSLYVGRYYTYDLNGISNWKILYIGSGTISIIPSTPKATDLHTNRNGTNIKSYIMNEIEKYKDDNVVSVRSISVSDVSTLQSIKYQYGPLYTGELLETYTSEYNYSNYLEKRFHYSNEVIRYNRNCNWAGTSCTFRTYKGTSNYTLNSYEAGFRPVIKIKYKDNDDLGKSLESDIKIGDYVKYSANGYNTWRVLNVDKKKGTVDIISSGIVKNLTLEGKDGFDNFTTILQEEIEKYKVGKDAISARVLEHSDFDKLSKLNEKSSIKFILGNKIKTIINTDYFSNYNSSIGDYEYIIRKVMGYGFAVGYYNLEDYTLDYDWAFLEMEAVDGNSSSNYVGSYKYTVGIRPVITLKLSEVEKEEEEKVPEKEEDALEKDEELKEDQDKANQTDKTLPLINNKKIIKKNIIYLQSIAEDKEFDVDNNKTADLESNYKLLEEVIINKDSSKRKVAIGLIILSIILLALAFILKLIKFFNKKDFRVK